MSHWRIYQPTTSDVTNIETNPGFEKATTGYAAAAGWSIQRSGTYAYRGLYSLTVIDALGPTAVETAVTHAFTFGEEGTYYISARVYVLNLSAIDEVSISAENYAGSTLTVVQDWQRANNPAGQWFRIYSTLAVVAGDLAGNILIKAANDLGDSNIAFFVDMVQITKDALYTEFDGDTDNCYWTGAQWLSTSVAPADIRNVGVETDLDDLNFTVLHGASGLGMPPVRHKTSGGDTEQGQVLTGANVMPRVISIPGVHRATSRAGMHSYRKDILDVIYPDSQRLTYFLRYYGANSNKPVEGEFVYDSGFEYNESTQIGFNDDINWRSIAYDPFWYELAIQKDILTTRATSTFDYLAAKVAGDWSDLGSTFNSSIYALAYDEKNDILYAGGGFTSPHKYIAKYTNGAWSAVGVGMNAAVRAIAIASNGDVYIGGDFTDIFGGGGGTYNRIVKWDISASAWVALGTGMSNSVMSIAIDRVGKVYVGGNFVTGNGVTLNRIGYWSGATFVAMDGGVSAGTVEAIAITRNNNVYICGTFATAGAGALTVNNVAKWTGSAWEALGSGVSSQALCLALDDAGNLYVGGTFATASGVTVNNIALWTGSGWYPLDVGVSGYVYRMDYSDGFLWVSGNFTSASGLALADRIAIWNGSAWIHADVDLPGAPTAYAILALRQKGYLNVYIGFSTTGAAVYSVDTTINYTGSAPGYPVFKVWNEGGAVNDSVTYLKNENTGATVWMDYTLQPEEIITIDFNPNHFSITSNFFGDAGYMILGGSGLNFYLRPGTNVITCFTPDAAVTAGLESRIAHWSVDGVAA